MLPLQIKKLVHMSVPFSFSNAPAARLWN